jgi:uncharacterized lipoprotein YajG
VQQQKNEALGTTLKALAAIALALALTGCQTMRDHPKVTAFVATSLALSAGIAIHNRDRRDDTRTHDIEIPRSPCTVQPSGSCR